MKKKKVPEKVKQNGRLGKIFTGILVLALTALLAALILSRFFPPEEAAANPVPDYVKARFLTENPYSRPGDKLTEVRNIVIHYVGNPGTSAEANRNYFDNLRKPAANPSGTKASAHFIVGLDGEVIQCIPLSEIAYANYPRNEDTVSVEVCHPDDTGRFSDVTREALVRFVADLLKSCGLTADDVIRHYDVSGKLCPKFYAENEDEWQQLKADIEAHMKQ